MIHFATVYWKTQRWIEPQQRHIVEYTKYPYKVYAYCAPETDISSYKDRFFFIENSSIKLHQDKLNKLFGIIADGIQ